MSTQLLLPTFPPTETANNLLFNPSGYDGGVPFSYPQGCPELDAIVQGLVPDSQEVARPNVLPVDSLAWLQGKSAIRTMHEKMCKTHGDDANSHSPGDLLDVDTSSLDGVFLIKPVRSDYGPNVAMHPTFDNSFYQYHAPEPGHLPSRIATTLSAPNVSGEFDIPGGNEWLYKGNKRSRQRYEEHARYSPYDRTQRQYAANSERWSGGGMQYPPLELPPSLGPAYQEDTTAQHSGDQNGASPRFSEFRNRDGDAGVTSDFGLPSPAASTGSSTMSSSSLGSSDDSMTRKHYTDAKRSKDTNIARNRFRTLFPSTKLLKSEEIAVSVCRYMLSTRIVPGDEGDVQRWSQSNQTSAAGPSRSEGSKMRVKALPNDKSARRRESKCLSDSRRQAVKHALDDELRALFGLRGSLLDTMDLAYDFLVYAKERGTVPDMASPIWRRERESMNVVAEPFFDKAK
ncbi:hypothetical protein EYR40_009705 [Pleurotus pulmonarius]|nr:hypothetical protein EYR38_002745 [Pleurotus pulmonarius]KAF4591105.1 hypothetical protein EYR40_009705 [Pleurotus pulmonarius]